MESVEYTVDIMPKSILDALFRFNDICHMRGLEYSVSGTTALYLLGLSTTYPPGDIDIRVYNITEEQLKWLKELDHLSAIIEEQYKNSACYTSIVGVKLNILLNNKCKEDFFSENIAVKLIDYKAAKHHTIYVNRVKYALREKMKLGRPKDMRYMLNLIKELTSNEIQ